MPEEILRLGLSLIETHEPYAEFLWFGEGDRRCWRVQLVQSQYNKNPSTQLSAAPLESIPYDLTRRELEIVTLIAAGGANEAISNALALSTRTVTTHITNILRKLGVASRSEIASVAFNEHLTALPLPEGVAWLDILRLSRLYQARGQLTFIAKTTPEHISTLKIGALIPATGRGAWDGTEMLNGAQLAIEEINARGGVQGKRLSLEVANIDVDNLGSLQKAMDDLRNANVEAITSGYIRHQIAAMDSSASEELPFLHSSASSMIERLVASSPERYKGVFQFCPTDSEYAPNFVWLMTKLRNGGQWHPTSKTLVIAHQTDWEFVDFGLSRAQAAAEAEGWNLVTLEAGSTDSPDRWSRLAEEANRIKPAAIMFASYFVDEHEQFLSTLDSLRCKALRYGIYAPSMPEFRSRLGQLGEGLLWASTTGTYSDDLANKFALRYQRRFGQAPGRSHAGIAYDRIQILAQAWRQAENPLDRASVVEILSDSRYRGLNGAYAFGTPGHGTLALGSDSQDPSLAQAHTVFQIQQGRNILISPAPYAVGQFQLPAWAEGFADFSSF